MPFVPEGLASGPLEALGFIPQPSKVTVLGSVARGRRALAPARQRAATARRVDRTQGAPPRPGPALLRVQGGRQQVASKSACKAGELGWLTSSLWLTAFLDSLANDQLLQIIAAMVEEVHRRAQDGSCTEEDITVDTVTSAGAAQEQLLTLLAAYVPPNTRRFRV